MPLNKEKVDVFISYSRSDKASAERVADALRSAGLRVWLDMWELVPGESWEAALDAALEQASSIAVFVGPSGLAPSQQREVPGVNYLGRSTSIILAGGSEA